MIGPLYSSQSAWHCLHRDGVRSVSHCFWQALYVNCTKMHTSTTPPTPCQSLTTTKTLCTHLVWRPKKSQKEGVHDRESNQRLSDDKMKGQSKVLREQLISMGRAVFGHETPINLIFKSHLFVENGKIQLMPKILNHLFTYYLNCVGKSNPVCLIQQFPLVILLASDVQWLYFLILPGKIYPFTFSHLCSLLKGGHLNVSIHLLNK